MRDPRDGARGQLKNIIMSQGYAHSWALLADGGFLPPEVGFAHSWALPLDNPAEVADIGPQCATRALEPAGRQKISLCPRATLTVGPCSQTGAFASRSGLRSTLGLTSRQSCGSGRHRSSVRDPRAGARGPPKNIIMSQGYAHSWALLADGGFCLQKWASLNVGPCLSTILRKWQT